jgi:hypothetical protein
MDLDASRKELKKYESMREMVLRLNELGKFNITYGLGYVATPTIYLVKDGNGCNGGCLACKNYTIGTYDKYIISNIQNCNTIRYYLCDDCRDKNYKLCATCLRESKECAALTKIKITFWLCATHKFTKFIIPKDIRRLIINFLN